MSFSGDKKLLKRMDELSKKASNKIGKKAITAGVKLMAKAIKKEIPSTQKSARKAIGYSFKRPRSGKLKHVIFAKAGWRAGMTKAKRAKKALKSTGERKRKGIGGEAAAVMLIGGTANRFTGTTRVGRHRGGGASRTQQRRLTGGKVKFTGRIGSPNRAVADARQAAMEAAKAVIKGTFAAELMKELKRI